MDSLMYLAQIIQNFAKILCIQSIETNFWIENLPQAYLNVILNRM